MVIYDRRIIYICRSKADIPFAPRRGELRDNTKRVLLLYQEIGELLGTVVAYSVEESDVRLGGTGSLDGPRGGRTQRRRRGIWIGHRCVLRPIGDSWT